VAGSGGITGPSAGITGSSGIGPSAAVNGRITVGNAGWDRGIIGPTGVANGATGTGLAINCARIAIKQGFHPDSFYTGTRPGRQSRRRARMPASCLVGS
jgi:hypothetical protein